MENRFGELIDRTAATYGLDSGLLTAQIQIESSFDPNAFRYEPAFFRKYIKDNPDAKGHTYGPLAACSYGLLQIMLETALEIGFEDEPERLFVPQIGLAWGAKYLQKCLKKAGGQYKVALARYNGAGAAAAAYAEKVFTVAGRT